MVILKILYFRRFQSLDAHRGKIRCLDEKPDCLEDLHLMILNHQEPFKFV